jgi:ATP-dependent RNA helicase SUPV3L1/SUV3
MIHGMQRRVDAPELRAVLGPTNTGKTRLAIDRMLGHASGMIGFPLRLLARENYERIVRLKGPGRVALITGEEKIVPPSPAYFICTVEAMPLDVAVDFLAIDEVQLCGDPERGHVFTDRLLHARGRQETLFLGAETIRPLLRRLVPEARIERRPRFSSLAYDGPRKLTRLPPRSAVVAFSAAEVYETAEMIRRHKGGTAVVMGGLSPRTRNAQVALFQEGDVDYLVATDAIGMGLNMDIDHVAFAGLTKFDGHRHRSLRAAELAQIAGRAGRYTNDGTFGTALDIGPIDPAMVEAIENHRFKPLRGLKWRNRALDFGSLDGLLHSLRRPPGVPGLERGRDADDMLALAALARNADIRRRAAAPRAVSLLWEVCRIPDFRKLMSENHANLLARVYRFLSGPEERLPADWIDRQVARLDRTCGDMHTLTWRIANIRVWTYIANRPDWVDDAAHWQGRTRAIEDRLSDALHQALTQRFVDRRTTVLKRRLKDDSPLLSAVKADGAVLVEGEPIGRLDGFVFEGDLAGAADEGRAIAAAAQRALRGEIDRRIRALEDDDDTAFALDAAGRLLWRGAAVARLLGDRDALAPRVAVLSSDLLDGPRAERLRVRLAGWLDSHLRALFAPLYAAVAADLPGPARGVVYHLRLGLGTARREGPLRDLLSALDPPMRARLRRLGVRFAEHDVFFPALLKPRVTVVRARLSALHARLDAPLPLPPAGQPSAPLAGKTCAIILSSVGHRRLGGRMVRVDIVEKIAREARRVARHGAADPARLAGMAGCGGPELAAVLRDLGYRVAEAAAGGFALRADRRKPRRPAPDASRRSRSVADSPFAQLKDLVPAK